MHKKVISYMFKMYFVGSITSKCTFVHGHDVLQKSSKLFFFNKLHYRTCVRQIHIPRFSVLLFCIHILSLNIDSLQPCYSERR